MSEEYDQSKGGEQWGEDDGPNIRHDDFVARVVRDPKEPPNLLLLSGYLGSSSEEGHVRLYLDEELSRYVEVPEKAIRHTQELPPEQSPLGGSLVWIDRDAEVTHGAAGAERRKATFLEGQIAQDYIGSAAAGTGAGTANFPSIAAGCGQSYFGPCIPRTELLGCRTLTGILCTRLGPLCGRTSYDPVCTIAGPNCRTLVHNQCQSIYNICVTHDIECQASGFVPCNPPIDTTIWQQPGGGVQFEAFAAPGGVGGVGGGGGVTATIIQTGSFNCPSVFDNCATVTDSFCPTRLPGCGFTRFGCPPSVFIRCPTRDFNCPTPFCPTRTGPRCLISQVAICNTVVCQFESAACNVDPQGGGVVAQARQGGLGGAGLDPTIGVFQTGFNCPSVFDNCATQEAFCPTLSSTCPSRLVVCQSQFNSCVTRTCPSVVVRCQTINFNCPSVAIRCPTRGEPRCFASQIAFCPDTRAGCQFESAACGVDPLGGGIAQGFEAQAAQAPPVPTQFCQAQGGGGGGAAAAIALPPTRLCPSQLISCITQVNCLTRTGCQSRYIPCQSQLIRCQSQLDACPTRFNCPTLPNGCPGYTRLGTCETLGPCPSAVDACPTRLGCYETAAGCGESIACNPWGGFGGGFDPGGGGFGGGF